MKQLLFKRRKQILIILVVMILTLISGCSKQNHASNQVSNQALNQTSNQTAILTPTIIPTLTPTLTPPTPTKSSEDKEQEIVPTITTDEEQKEETYIDMDSNKFGALIFMGAELSEEELSQRKQLITDEYLTNSNKTSDNEKDEFAFFEFGGKEVYCILPHYVGSTITVKRTELSDDGNLEATDTLATSDKPIFIQCNESDLHSNVIITIEHKEDSITFSPYISMKDGSVSPVDNMEVIDLTQE